MNHHYAIGAITPPTNRAELGDAPPIGGGDQVVRYMGLDVTVYASDGKRSPGVLSIRHDSSGSSTRPRSGELLLHWSGDRRVVRNDPDMGLITRERRALDTDEVGLNAYLRFGRHAQMLGLGVMVSWRGFHDSQAISSIACSS